MLTLSPAMNIVDADFIFPEEEFSADEVEEPELRKEAAGVMLYDPNYPGYTLTVYNTKKLCLGFPCGKVEPGETLQEAAVRELFEETGVQISPEQCTQDYHAGLYGDTFVKIYFVSCCFDDIAYVSSIPGEHLEIDIREVDDLVAITAGSYSSFNARALRTFNMIQDS